MTNLAYKNYFHGVIFFFHVVILNNHVVIIYFHDVKIIKGHLIAPFSMLTIYAFFEQLLRQ